VQILRLESQFEAKGHHFSVPCFLNWINSIREIGGVLIEIDGYLPLSHNSLTLVYLLV
jgi:hypothetical protein